MTADIDKLLAAAQKRESEEAILSLFCKAVKIATESGLLMIDPRPTLGDELTGLLQISTDEMTALEILGAAQWGHAKAERWREVANARSRVIRAAFKIAQPLDEAQAEAAARELSASLDELAKLTGVYR